VNRTSRAAVAAAALVVAGAIAARAGGEGESPRAALIARLHRLTSAGQFLFGQQHATLWGMYLEGGLVSTGAWFDATARVGRLTSDSAAVVGDSPAVLGVSLGMLAFEPADWNRAAPIASAVRRHVGQGGVVTMEWHAPSCGADLPPGAPLGTVDVSGHEVPILPVPGGSSFYAEEEYRHHIASREDVPESLRCLCEIANDAPIGAGPYKGTSGKAWLVAHAKHAARVLRLRGLADLPIIVRPFHEHNGSWFWWGQPYWNCAALLGKPDAVSGADAYKSAVRTFVSAMREEPGMGNLLFAYSTDKLLGPREKETFTRAQNKVRDPGGHARDLLRERLVRELGAAHLLYESAAQKAATLRSSDATAPRRADAYVAQRRPYYVEAYAGDDVFDVLGIDLYHPVARAANDEDLRLFRLQLRVVAEEARSRGKSYALTEAGTYRLQLEELASQTAAGQPVPLNGKSAVEEALARLFDPADRAALLASFGLTAAGPIVLAAADRAAVVPKPAEDWFNRQLLVLAKESRVAYALVWQTYYQKDWTDRYYYYYVPYPGHPDARSFQRFYDDPATCFLRDDCGR
jgi:hypothetical protein